MIQATDLKKALYSMRDKMAEERDYLCELDRHLGDGDHGVTMDIGWKAVAQALDDLDAETDISVICKQVAMAFLNAVGSSVGPLYATGFLQAGKPFKGKNALTSEDVATFWIAFAEGIEARGGAKIGDKTMVDTLAPMAAYLRERGGGFDGEGALAAAEKGMESTKRLQANVGRSSRLGERSIGTIDPGAASAFLLFKAFCDSVQPREKV
ncbi:dihydroxyacetone kinase subunit DhaL [Shouchella clausii]|uniref:phosphoenolpyruvate--glycerone phosphotransferase n=3 Tax=Shouchella TaxID=2893057 RepID=Q5WBW8_SHOC1|nr:dihydroxyacetone kinase subunit DhaL [Shouchella clausii]MED4158740.1 dihydroxyacetone kinase subunit DhaL [Shouchella clausii]MED4176463.1 dihydroxyacetone kinase subunit DhaL [Shouchella clausii]PAE88639.1 dihydroxyacetone kinase subunit L [Shouchella clausii]BAD66142.1 dihydroxyacetone kinase [Shouchella clausii KSM-K16]